MKNFLYILGGPEGHTPVGCDDVARWAEWMAHSDRHLAVAHEGEVIVSTIFTGTNLRYIGKGPPIVFETMTFRGTTKINLDGVDYEMHAASDRKGEDWRYATWDDALAGHQAICRRVFGKAKASTKEDRT